MHSLVLNLSDCIWVFFCQGLSNLYVAWQNALEPHMSKDTLEFHWGKHHRAYVDNLNKQIVGTELGDGKSLEDVVIASYNKGDLLPAFNNAAQV